MDHLNRALDDAMNKVLEFRPPEQPLELMRIPATSPVVRDHLDILSTTTHEPLVTIYLDDGSVDVHGDPGEAATVFWQGVQLVGQDVFTHVAQAAEHVRKLQESVRDLAAALKREQARADALQGECQRLRRQVQSP